MDGYKMKMSDFLLYGLLSISLIIQACSRSDKEHSEALLELLRSDFTGIGFRNDLEESLTNNIYLFTNFYNGGGVAVGDINNDGLTDIYLSANINTGKLYLNKGGFKFEDITKGSGLDTISGWKTGVTMVDINQDGFLDIYLCRSGKTRPKLRSNLLFVNNGDLTFTEKGKEYGLNDWGISVQATFFDYDLDGDLDMYLLNNSTDPVRRIFKNFHDRDINRYIGDKLYNNANGYFTEIKDSIGINRSKLGDGLGVAVADLNNDLYPDIYISNDFAGRDYLYFNNGDGTFTESALKSLKHISYSSMGNNAADIDNDGWQDLFELDMRNSTHYGRKTNMASINPVAFNILIDLDAHYQYMRNTLQLNNGNETFSDIAPMAGVTNTDWSWSPLLVDLDNDGYKDLFISNGMRKNTNNKDYIAYKDKAIENETKKADPDFETMIWDILSKLPTEEVVNQSFKNINGLLFERYNETWGVTEPSFSNGAAYADFDNDGDMDFVFNNIDQEAHVYRNNASQISGNHFLRVKLKGSSANINGMGAKVMVQAGDKKQYLEQQVSRGYQSSVDFILHFGLGKSELVDLLKVTWPDGQVSELTNVEVDQFLSVDHSSAFSPSQSVEKQLLLFSDVTTSYGLNHKHVENEYNDFKREALLPHKMSTFGPALSVGDINNDGLDDFFIGGAMGDEGAVYTQHSDGSFTKTRQKDIALDREYEDTDAHFFDADLDGDIDLYVVSGGNELPAGDDYYQDRLYFNNGKGYFIKSPKALPPLKASGGVVRTNDFDEDGDLDLFIGGRLLPGLYPKPGRSYLLENANGKFEDVTAAHTKELEYPGMVTDALWSDFDGDGTEDLILVGEWMPVAIFRNHAGKLTKFEGDSTLSNSHGWWFSIAEGDVNGDGRMDYIVGNLGENYQHKAQPGAPFKLFSKDFDNNGTLDIVLGYYENDTLYPVHDKEYSLRQIPGLKNKYKDYDSFGTATLECIYSARNLEESELYEAKTFSSSMLINTGKGFELVKLPQFAQISAVFGIIYDDFDDDGLNDIIMAGNLYNTEMETPRSDAGQGLFLKGDGKGGFQVVRGYNSGLFIPGDVKKLKAIQLGEGSSARKGVIAGINNNFVRLITTQ
ncbi:MAG: VCBS repeat-containing protein [Bacteroidales bacterium]|nr:VCBS repeat-containing protein [Bacteroidales bacterium]